MAMARSRITAQGQISVPLEVRRKLGVSPGSMIEWSEKEGEIVVRRSGRYSSEDIHRMLFPREAPERRKIEDLKQGIRKNMRRRHARG
ncbi:MAG TPA: AbrB/MazE/SpoVT family DNA-binding domain-containing protein [Bryobacteraceae bacterium]